MITKEEQAKALFNSLKKEYPHIEVCLEDAQAYLRKNPDMGVDSSDMNVHYFADWLLANGADAQE